MVEKKWRRYCDYSDFITIYTCDSNMGEWNLFTLALTEQFFLCF